MLIAEWFIGNKVERTHVMQSMKIYAFSVKIGMTWTSKQHANQTRRPTSIMGIVDSVSTVQMP